MLSGIGKPIRESTPWLMMVLRLLDSLLAACLLYPIAVSHTGAWSDQYQALMALAFCLSLVVFHKRGLYTSWRGRNYLSELRTIIEGWLSAVCVILFLLFAFKVAASYSRVVLVSWFVITPLLLFLVHGLARGLLRHLRSRGKNLKTAVIVGAADLGVQVADYIRRLDWAGIRVLGFFDDIKPKSDPEKRKSAGPYLGTLSSLPEYLRSHDIDLVYITLPMSLEKKIQQILHSCRTLGAKIYFVPDLYIYRNFNSRIERFGDLVMLGFNPDSQRKRFFDIGFSLLVLAVTLPFTLFIALCIKLQDGGPVLYGHRRITSAGKEFLCLKFRSMHVDADAKLKTILERDPKAREEWEKTFKLKQDPRVTWIGRFLRKTSLDELPQFINVLKGEMSVVGARPIVHRELNEYYKENGGVYCSLKPGVTGIWQVSKRSDTEDYQERVNMDTWYALNRNMWLDLKIIVKTVVCVVSGRGAY